MPDTSPLIAKPDPCFSISSSRHPHQLVTSDPLPPSFCPNPGTTELLAKPPGTLSQPLTRPVLMPREPFRAICPALPPSLDLSDPARPLTTLNAGLCHLPQTTGFLRHPHTG